jgi:hypothetical protein
LVSKGIGSVDLFGESPYIGKGRFQKLERANRMSVNQEFDEVISMDSVSLDSEERDKLHAEIDQELIRKKRDIHDGIFVNIIAVLYSS